MKRSLFIVLLVFAATLIGMAQNPVLQVTGGKIQGVESTKGVIIYKGIPYAAPPTGDLRWKAPQDVLNIGDEVKVKIIEIDFDKKRVSLSIKELLDKPEEVIEELADAPEKEAVETEAPVEEAAE